MEDSNKLAEDLTYTNNWGVMMKAQDREIKTIVKNASIIIFILMTCLVCLSIFIRQKSFTTVNDVDDRAELRTSVIFNDIKMVTNDDIFSHDSLQKETTDCPLIKFIRSEVKDGDTIIHISNDVGIQTLLMAKQVGQSGRVYIYNPYEKYTNTIKKSAEANGYETRIKIKTCAVSDSSFDGILVYKNNFPILSGELHPATYQTPAGHSSLAVSVFSIDELLPNLQNVTFLRINSMNCLKALRGAEKLISRSQSIVIVLDFPRQEDLQKVIEFVDKFGFKMFTIQNEGKLLPAENISKEKSEFLVLKKK